MDFQRSMYVVWRRPVLCFSMHIYCVTLGRGDIYQELSLVLLTLFIFWRESRDMYLRQGYGATAEICISDIGHGAIEKYLDRRHSLGS